MPVAVRGVDFLIPGVSLESVSFDAGARVKYLVISYVYGESDSSVVDLAVIDYKDGEVIIEIASSPYPAIEGETVTVRLLIDENVKSISSPEEFDDCIRKISVKDGLEPFREPTEEEMEDFDINEIFLKSSAGMKVRVFDQEELETPAGRFGCDVYEYSKSDVYTVELGGIEAERFEQEISILWLSGDIPFWGLVRSRVEKTKLTRILEGVSPLEPEPRTTITESILISYIPGDTE